jgi:predicted anti-sigma-YlaC factor YlaD
LLETRTVQLDLSHGEARNLFPALLDEALADGEASRLTAHLADCAECRSGWEGYSRAVKVVREVKREKAPPELAGNILRRVRRRRFRALQALERAQADYRVPYEVIVPILLAVAVAVAVLLGMQ